MRFATAPSLKSKIQKFRKSDNFSKTIVTPKNNEAHFQKTDEETLKKHPSKTLYELPSVKGKESDDLLALQ